jgi:hypothetical protein
MGALKSFDLSSLIKDFNLKYFFETGTGYGHSLEYACGFNFEKLASVEIDARAYSIATENFKSDKRVCLFYGNSFDVLNKQLQSFDKNTLFWLDAHYPSADVGGGDYTVEKNIDIRLPLEKELELILNRADKYRDVILIDDARIYFKDNFEAKNLYEINYENIAKYNGLPILEEFKPYFKIEKSLQETGYIIITPNKQ